MQGLLAYQGRPRFVLVGWGDMMSFVRGDSRETRYQEGAWVIYRVQKTSVSPGPRARGVIPAPNGDTYTYQVDKFWVIDRVLPDGKLLLRTRRGKEHVVDPQNSRLRLPTWWEVMLYGSRFRRVQSD